jgi:hypothetical protein
VLLPLMLLWATSEVDVYSEAGREYLADGGEEVVWDDGLVANAGDPDCDGGTCAVSVTLTNAGGDDDIRVLDGADVAFRADGDVLPGDAAEAEGDRSAELAPGESATVAYRVTVPDGTAALGLDLAPGRRHSVAYWEFDVPGGGGDGSGGGDGDGVEA